MNVQFHRLFILFKLRMLFFLLDMMTRIGNQYSVHLGINQLGD